MAFVWIPNHEWLWEKSQVNCGMDFHFTFLAPAFTREKVVGAAAKHHNPMFHAGQWQGWGQQCVIFESLSGPPLLCGPGELPLLWAWWHHSLGLHGG